MLIVSYVQLDVYERKNSQLTNTVVSKVDGSSGNILGVLVAALVRGGAQAETIGITPATDSHAHLGAVVEERTDVGQVLEGLVLAGRLGCEKRRVGESSDDVGDARCDRLVGNARGVVPLRAC